MSERAIKDHFEINKFIAEFCGWTNVRLDYHKQSIIGEQPKTGEFGHIPLYTESLDAMHEVEKLIGSDPKYIQKHAYNNYMSDLSMRCVHSFHAIGSSAIERAESFVVTMQRLNLK